MLAKRSSALLDMLKNNNLLQANDVERITRTVALSGGSVITSIMEDTNIPEKVLNRALSKIYKVKTVEPKSLARWRPEKVPLRKSIAEKYRIVPLARKDRTWIIAVADPDDQAIHSDLKALLQSPIEIRVISDIRLSWMLHQAYGTHGNIRLFSLFSRLDKLEAPKKAKPKATDDAVGGNWELTVDGLTQSASTESAELMDDDSFNDMYGGKASFGSFDEQEAAPEAPEAPQKQVAETPAIPEAPKKTAPVAPAEEPVEPVAIGRIRPQRKHDDEPIATQLVEVEEAEILDEADLVDAVEVVEAVVVAEPPVSEEPVPEVISPAAASPVPADAQEAAAQSQELVPAEQGIPEPEPDEPDEPEDIGAETGDRDFDEESFLFGDDDDDDMGDIPAELIADALGQEPDPIDEPVAEIPLPQELTLDEAVAAIGTADTRERLAEILMGLAVAKFKRCVLLTVAGDHIIGWSGYGDGINHKAIEQLWIPLDEDSAFKFVVDSQAQSVGPIADNPIHSDFFELFGGARPQGAFLMPLRYDGEVSQIIWMDDGDGQPAGYDISDILIFAVRVPGALQAIVDRAQKELVG